MVTLKGWPSGSLGEATTIYMYARTVDVAEQRADDRIPPKGDRNSWNAMRRDLGLYRGMRARAGYFAGRSFTGLSLIAIYTCQGNRFLSRYLYLLDEKTISFWAAEETGGSHVFPFGPALAWSSVLQPAPGTLDQSRQHSCIRHRAKSHVRLL